MAYDNIFIDGFDKYHDVLAVAVQASLSGTGEWTTTGANTTLSVVSPLGAGATGFGLGVSMGSGEVWSKSLPANYARLIGGFHYKRTTVSTIDFSLQFMDGAATQCCIEFPYATGALKLYRGDKTTLLATSTETIAANATVCVEYDITLHNSTGIAKIWIDGVLTSINLSSQDLCSTANNHVNGIQFKSLSNYCYFQIDHFYLMMFTSAGSGDTPLLDNPYVETQVPVTDDHSDFTIEATSIGQRYTVTYDAYSANRLHVQKVTPDDSGTLSSLNIIPRTTSAGANLKGVVYADSSGAPGARLSDGTTVVGTVNNTILNLPLATPVSLTAGTPVWIGFISTIGIDIQDRGVATANCYYRSGQTIGSLPDPYGSATSTTDFPWTIWGSVTGGTSSVQVLDDNELLGDYNYVSSGTVGHYDAYHFGALTSSPSTIHTVAVKAYVAGSGGQTIDIQTRSGGTTGTGSASGFTPGAGYTYKASYFKTDPDTAAAWDPDDLGNATGGFEIKS